MANITDNITYVDFSKLTTFNQSIPTVELGDFNNIQNDIISVLANYSELQWFLSIIIFVSIFLIIRRIQFIDLTDTQIAVLSSFVIMAMNIMLLLMDIFTIIQPFQLFTLLWLILVIAVIANKRR